MVTHSLACSAIHATSENAFFIWITVPIQGKEKKSQPCFCMRGKVIHCHAWNLGTNSNDMREILHVGQNAHELPDEDGLVLWCCTTIGRKWYSPFVCLGWLEYCDKDVNKEK